MSKWGYFVGLRQPRPLAWVRTPWFVISVKRTRDELFSERNGYRRVLRLRGLSFVVG